VADPRVILPTSIIQSSPEAVKVTYGENITVDMILASRIYLFAPPLIVPVLGIEQEDADEFAIIFESGATTPTMVAIASTQTKRVVYATDNVAVTAFLLPIPYSP
jgi:hypothetical protein